MIRRTIEVSNLEEVADWGVIKEKIRTALRKYFDQETGKRPMILPVILRSDAREYSWPDAPPVGVV